MGRNDLPWNDQIRIAGIRGCLIAVDRQKLRDLHRALMSRKIGLDDLQLILQASVAIDRIEEYVTALERGDPEATPPELSEADLDIIDRQAW